MRVPRPAYLLGGLLLVYLAYPLGAFAVRLAQGGPEGWNVAGLWGALGVSAEGATIALAIGVLAGIPLAYVLAHRRGRLASIVSLIVQIPLAIPPLMSGILLIYLIGPYTFLGRLSGERLTQTMYGVVIAMSFVSAPFLVVVARSAFRGVDPALGEVAATLGHGPLSRFLRVEVPAASDGLRTGMVLMWLRAFGEYGTTVVLAYHPYSLPVYVYNLFSSAPLSQSEAPTALACAVAAVVVVLGRTARIPGVRRAFPADQPPSRSEPAVLEPSPPHSHARKQIPVRFALETTVGSFHLSVAGAPSTSRLAVVGPSGSGKSLTLRGLAGLLGPGTGKVSYGSSDMTHVAPERRRVGYVPQGDSLLPGQTVWQQATFGRLADAERAAWWLHALHLEELADRRPHELSGGQRQRVSIARALAGDPELLLLDEPFSALDAPVRAELRRELRRLQRQVGLSSVIVTHDPQEAATLGEEILVISGGRVLQAGPCGEVLRRPASAEVGRLLGLENLFEGSATRSGALLTQTGSLPLTGSLPPGTRAMWQLAPEGVEVLPAPPAGPPGPGRKPGGQGRDEIDLGPATVRDVIDLGRAVELTVVLAAGPELRARPIAAPELTIGSACRAIADAQAISAWELPSTRTASPRAHA
jgi:ABC-type sulfate/molybdate transport systems ATPase subunit/ABC-type sulfate transport system permease component